MLTVHFLFIFLIGFLDQTCLFYFWILEVKLFFRKLFYFYFIFISWFNSLRRWRNWSFYWSFCPRFYRSLWIWPIFVWGKISIFISVFILLSKDKVFWTLTILMFWRTLADIFLNCANWFCIGFLFFSTIETISWSLSWKPCLLIVNFFL